MTSTGVDEGEAEYTVLYPSAELLEYLAFLSCRTL